MSNNLSKVIKALDEGSREDNEAIENGWTKKSKQQSVSKLALKHAARVQSRRMAKDMFGKGLLGSIIALVASSQVSKIK